MADSEKVSSLPLFTPGPWSLFPMKTGWYINQQGGPGYIGTMHRISHRAEECEANAHLIAAAPDLLAAAQKAERLLRVGNGGLFNGCDAQVALAAAIAKALGEQP